MTEAYVFDALRTPRGKGKKDGTLHEVKPIDLLVGLLTELQARHRFDTAAVDDVVMGIVSPVGEQGSVLPKVAALKAGWDFRCAGVQVNRFCASGLEAVNLAAMKVRSGFEDLVVAGGVESMSRIPMGSDGGAWAMDPATNMHTNFVPQGVGAMAAVLGLDDDQVQAICAQAAQGEVVEAVNFNSPGQVVIAGNVAAVERAMAAAKEAGAKRALPLPVSVPSHCSLMKPAAEKLAEALQDVVIHTPQIRVIHNADVAAYDDADKIKDALVRQLYSPVRWTETVNALVAEGIAESAECGPGKVLAGLAKRINKEAACTALTNAEQVAVFIEAH